MDFFDREKKAFTDSNSYCEHGSIPLLSSAKSEKWNGNGGYRFQFYDHIRTNNGNGKRKLHFNDSFGKLCSLDYFPISAKKIIRSSLLIFFIVILSRLSGIPGTAELNRAGKSLEGSIFHHIINLRSIAVSSNDKDEGEAPDVSYCCHSNFVLIHGIKDGQEKSPETGMRRNDLKSHDYYCGLCDVLFREANYNFEEAAKLRSSNEPSELSNSLLLAAKKYTGAGMKLLDAMKAEEKDSSFDSMKLSLIAAECNISLVESRSIEYLAYLKEEEEKVEGREVDKWKEAIEMNLQAINYFKNSFEAKRTHQLIEGTLWESAGLNSEYSALQIQLEIIDRHSKTHLQSEKYRVASELYYQSSEAYQQAALLLHHNRHILNRGNSELLSQMLNAFDRVVTVDLLFWFTAAVAYEISVVYWLMNNLSKFEEVYKEAEYLKLLAIAFPQKIPGNVSTLNASITADDLEGIMTGIFEASGDVIDAQNDLIRKKKEIVMMFTRSIQTGLRNSPHSITFANLLRLMRNEPPKFWTKDKQVLDSTTVLDLRKSISRVPILQSQFPGFRFEDTVDSDIKLLHHYEALLTERYGMNQAFDEFVSFILRTMEKWQDRIYSYPFQSKLDQLLITEGEESFSELTKHVYRSARSCLEKIAYLLSMQSNWFLSLALIVANEKYEEAIISLRPLTYRNQSQAYFDQEMLEQRSNYLYTQALAMEKLAYDSNEIHLVRDMDR